MRTNGQSRWIILFVMVLTSAALQAQWREVRFGMGEFMTHVIASDDGRGLAFFNDVNFRVVSTRDNWRTFDTVVLPAPEAPYVFEPYSYDTTANGTVVVVGQHRPPLDTLKGLRYCNTTTAAYYSTDWGRTWAEVLPRLPGRYMSIAYRGRAEGVLLYENDWKDSVEYAKERPAYEWYGRDLVFVDQEFRALSHTVIDETDSVGRFPLSGGGCIEGNPQKRSYIDRINDSILVMETIFPCANDYGIEDDPSGSKRHRSYQTLVSTNLGTTWRQDLGQWNINVGYSRTPYKTMKLVDDTTWIDNQGYLYEGTRKAPREFRCPGSENWLDYYWEISDAVGSQHLIRTTYDVLDSARKDTTVVFRVKIGVNLVTVRTCSFQPLPPLVCGIIEYDGYDTYGLQGLKPILTKNGRAILTALRESENIQTKEARYEWYVYIFDNDPSSSVVTDTSHRGAVVERDGVLYFSKPRTDAGLMEYYALSGDLVAAVAVEAGAQVSAVPQLSTGVYFARLGNEAPLKILVRR